MVTLISLVIAYLIGSLSCGIVIAKFFGGVDPRTAGSNNPGATNVLRLNGKNQAIMVLTGDILKGIIAIFIAKTAGVHGFVLGLVGVAAVLGHIFPLYFNFKGGKGVATALGVLFGLSLWLGIVTAITWLVIAAIFRYSSLAALVAAVFAPFYALIFGSAAYFLPVLIITVLIVWRHSENIKKLRNRTETKITL
jgi:glycerol-3-phosphate acyltransferase PlsY